MVGIPFFFCRYQLLIDEEILDFLGQVEALKELQGRFFAHGTSSRRSESLFDSVIMRPREIQVQDTPGIAWSVGRRIGARVSVEYDAAGDELTFATIEDPGIQYADFVAVPSLGVLAVDDRSGPPHLGGKAAINRFRSIFRNIDGGAVNIELTTSPQDVRRALGRWELTEFSFVVRPFNPHPPGDLSRQLSEQYSKDGIGRFRGKAQPTAGGAMRASEDGQIAAAIELADAGYGQYALKGITGEGHEAQIKQPQFDNEVRLNQKRQAQPRELRVIIGSDVSDDDLFVNIIKALVSFYSSHEFRAT